MFVSTSNMNLLNVFVIEKLVHLNLIVIDRQGSGPVQSISLEADSNILQVNLDKTYYK